MTNENHLRCRNIRFIQRLLIDINSTQWTLHWYWLLCASLTHLCMHQVFAETLTMESVHASTNCTQISHVIVVLTNCTKPLGSQRQLIAATCWSDRWSASKWKEIFVVVPIIVWCKHPLIQHRNKLWQCCKNDGTWKDHLPQYVPVKI